MCRMRRRHPLPACWPPLVAGGVRLGRRGSTTGDPPTVGRRRRPASRARRAGRRSCDHGRHDATDATPVDRPLDVHRRVDDDHDGPPVGATTTTTTVRRARNSVPSAGIADGNRVLVIGDSILAGDRRALRRPACATLVPMGWAVEVDAETGQPIEFGLEVLDAAPAAQGGTPPSSCSATTTTATPRAIEAEAAPDPRPAAPRSRSCCSPSRRTRPTGRGQLHHPCARRRSHDNVARRRLGRATADDDEPARAATASHPSDEGQEALVQMVARRARLARRAALMQMPTPNAVPTTCLDATTQ